MVGVIYSDSIIFPIEIIGKKIQNRRENDMDDNYKITLHFSIFSILYNKDLIVTFYFSIFFFYSKHTWWEMQIFLYLMFLSFYFSIFSTKQIVNTLNYPLSKQIRTHFKKNHSMDYGTLPNKIPYTFQAKLLKSL